MKLAQFNDEAFVRIPYVVRGEGERGLDGLDFRSVSSYFRDPNGRRFEVLPGSPMHNFGAPIGPCVQARPLDGGYPEWVPIAGCHQDTGKMSFRELLRKTVRFLAFALLIFSLGFALASVSAAGWR